MVVFTKNNCPQCKMLKGMLLNKGVIFQEINIDLETGYIDLLKSKNFRSAPVTLPNGVNNWEGSFSGFDINKVRALISLKAS